ncbi:hypothetical protein [Roseiconus lacunae]|uniref:HAMP domain-containing protein n=1 Tax=Roseiconus lacunae TaxID=2605694 RepID=A0ABT7PE78_9BACT|nr:hypothetical protein [Roseiconus lacunae]MCD0463662.1 hypothetical protein [Roseiconus lacunae]MDM4014781.1 hypothetical protein [Roseiconus lacunae]WRQ50370.1 hypothetical protein U8335_25890 [Stieleria sp. HD01]
MSNRRRFLVDRPVQFAIIRRMLVHWCLAILTLMVIGVFVQLAFTPDGVSLTQAIARSYAAQGPLLALMFVLMPVYIWDVVKLSHRFAGPMLRLRAIMSELADGGSATQLRFRPGDFWQETADDFNRFYDAHLALKDRCTELERRLERYERDEEVAEEAAPVS